MIAVHIKEYMLRIFLVEREQASALAACGDVFLSFLAMLDYFYSHSDICLLVLLSNKKTAAHTSPIEVCAAVLQAFSYTLCPMFRDPMQPASKKSIIQ